MVRLKNIKKSDTLIECYIYPEDSKSPGHVKYNILEMNVVDYKLPKGYEWCKNHISHVRAYFSQNSANEIPTEKTIMWG